MMPWQMMGLWKEFMELRPWIFMSRKLYILMTEYKRMLPGKGQQEAIVASGAWDIGF